MNRSRDVRDAVFSAFSRIPGASIESFPEGTTSHRRFESVLVLRSGSSVAKTPLLFEVVTQGYPRMLRLACSELHATLRRQDPERRAYPIVIAPFTSDNGIDVCAEEGVGCIDLAGNCRLAPGNAFVEIRGRVNRFPASRGLKSLFSPKSSRISRILLSDTQHWWQVQELARAAGVSIGLASALRQRLLDEELVESRGKSIRAHSPHGLLRLWSSHYTYRRNRIREFYALEGIPQFEARASAYCRDNGVSYALGLFSGAARVAPHVRYGKAFVYVKGDLEEIGSDLGLKPVASGPNVILLEPFDAGVLFGAREIGGAQVVSAIQLYLDLNGYEARGEEAAEFLMHEVLEPQWTHP